MFRSFGIGYQKFDEMIDNQIFYIDKTKFIEEWWEKKDKVTLITRPRRFGKTLTMSMVECFFSVEYAGRKDLFEGMEIFEKEDYRKLQGTFPVISLSFAEVKETAFEETRKKICQLIENLYNHFDYLLEGDVLNEKEKAFWKKVSPDMEDYTASLSIKMLAGFLSRFYNKQVIILLDEYDTPMQEAYIHGYWDELVAFTRSMLNSAFKTNPYLERAILTGITRVSKESIFSDLNNMVVITTTSTSYVDSFGFIEDEVFASLDQYGKSAQKMLVKEWYDGFTFGSKSDIYNPWSVLNFLDTGEYATYWANTSGNRLIGKLLQEGSGRTKQIFEQLLCDIPFRTVIDEQIVYNQLDYDETAIWSLLLAGGYLKVLSHQLDMKSGREWYVLALTNKEVHIMFDNMIRGWFARTNGRYNDFIQALLQNDKKAMNVYMNKIALSTFSYFDVGRNPSEELEPERFYHGFVLGLIVELEDDYQIRSNRESGFGRYDVVLEPKKAGMDAYIMEFKVHDPEDEKSLEDTVCSALQQIETKCYAAELETKGISKEQIRCLGFAFEGKKVLIG